MHKNLLGFYGLKWQPFSPGVPVEALYHSTKIDSFLWRVEHTLIREGGFAMISGDPGTGKSVALRLLADRLETLRDVTVGVISLPSARIADFYRQMGDLFGVELTAHNRWGGFKKLRERWQAHVESTLFQPVLLIDEAQEVPAGVLNELRLLSSTRFDSGNLLSVVLAGDNRLTQKTAPGRTGALGQPHPHPTGYRIRFPGGVDGLSQTLAAQCRQCLADDRTPDANLVRTCGGKLPYSDRHGDRAAGCRRREKARRAG
jgi:type II secretory pathway predicted ATPase ExeA